MKIGISINGVLRDFISQFIYTYEKYIGETNLKTEDITSLDLMKYFTFKSKDDLNKFLYLEAPLEIFGHADLIQENVVTHLNNFIMDIRDEEEHEVWLVSKEIDKSIPSTFFFLSKTGCKTDKINFVMSDVDEWKNIDLLLTANPLSLENKPNGKISVKIKTPYNTETRGDYEVDSLIEFIKDKTLLDKILNTKITSYEEI